MSFGGASLGESVLVLRTDQGPLNRGLAQAGASTARATAGMQATVDKRMTAMGASMSKVGSSMTRNITAPILGLIGASADFEAKFQAAMEMIHTQAGAPQREVQALTGKVLALGKAVPFGPTALAQSLFRIESVGLRGSKAMDALKASAQLAAIGQANLDDTTKALVQTYFTGIKGIGSFKNVVAELNATVGAGDMHLQDLTDALGQGILPAAKVAGLGLKDVLGAIAVFGDETKNVSGWTAQFATALHYLYAPTTKAATAMTSIHLGANQLANDLHKPNGLLVALQDLKTHLETLPGGVNGVKAAQVLGDILPGGRGRVLLVLLNQLDRYEQKLKQIGTTTSQFSGDLAKTQQTASYKLHQAWSTVETDLTQLGQKTLPIILTAAERTAGFVDTVVTDFLKLPKGVQDTIITGGLIVAGIGPAMKILGLFTSGIGRLVGAARVAERLLKTPLTPSGISSAFRGPAGVSGAQTVATMEVAEMRVLSMIGGVPGVAAGVPGAAAEARSAGGVILPPGVRDLTAAEREIGSAAKPAALSLGGVFGAMGAGIAVANGLRDAIGNQHGGLSGAISGFVHGITFGLIPELGKGLDSLNSLQRAQVSRQAPYIIDPNSIPPAVRALAALLAKIQSVKGDLSKLTPAALVKLKAEAEKLAADPSLAKYRGQILQVLGALGHVADNAVGEGTKIAQGLEKGWNSFKFQNEPNMVRQLVAKIKSLPPQMQAGAIRSALAFTKGLEEKGRLPAGAFKDMLLQVNALFPGWQKYIGQQAKLTAGEFARYLDFSKAEHNVNTALGKMAGDFPQVSQAMDATKGDIVQKAGAVINALRGIAITGSGPMRKQALADIAALKNVATADLNTLANTVNAKALGIKDSVSKNTAIAKITGSKNFQEFAGETWRYVNDGVISAGAGMNLIVGQVNKVLGQLGQKKLTPVQVVGIQVGSAIASAGQAPFARGGQLYQVGRPGEAGRDTVPMSMGGMDIVVGPGEVPMVATRHQYPEMDAWAREHGYRGLPDFFSKNDRPNYMEKGGFLTQPSAGGGGGSVVDLHSGDMTQGQEPQILTDLYALSRELAQTVYIISGYRTPQHSVAVGGFADDPHTRGDAADIGVGSPTLASMFGVTDAQLAAANASGHGLYRPFYPPDPAEANHVQLLGVPLGPIIGQPGTGGGSSGGLPAAIAAKVWKALTAPKVPGSGGYSEVVRAALSKETMAANAYGRKIVAKWNAAHGAGGGSASGPFNLSSLEALWGQAGGPAGAAHIAAAIALAESGGNPAAYNPISDMGSHAEGLWQIEMPMNAADVPGGNAYNPLANAQGAVKISGGGTNWSPWATFTSGAYQQFMARGGFIPGFARVAQHKASGGFVGLAKRMASGGMLGSRHDKHSRAFRVNASSETSGGQGAFGFSPGSHGKYGYSILSGSGLSTDPGPYGIALGPGTWKPPSDLLFKRGNHGPFKGSLQDIGAGDNSRPTIGVYENLIRALGGQVNSDLGGVDIERADGRWFTAMRGAPIAQFGKHAGGRRHGHQPHKHPNHPNHTHHKPHGGKPHKPAPHPNPRGGMPGVFGEPPADASAQEKYRWLTELLGDGSTAPWGVPVLSELLGYWPGIWAIQNPTASSIMGDPSAAIISQDSHGNPILPYIDAKDLAQARKWLVEQIGWEGGIVRDYKDAVPVSEQIARQLHAQIAEKKREIEKRKKKIRENLKRIKALTKKIAHNNKWISRTQTLMGNVPTGTSPSQGAGATKPDTAKINRYKTHISSLRKEIHGWNKDIHGIEHENKVLGGSPTSVGTGGKIGKIGQEIAPLQTMLGNVSDPGGTYSPDALVGITGVGGSFGQEMTNLQTLQAELRALDPSNLSKLLATAKEQATGSVSQEKNSLLAQQELELRQQLAVSQAQYATLSTALGSLPPFGGSFAAGGIVPGMLGEPRTIIAHGGEEITPVGGDGTPDIHLHFRPGTEWLGRFIDLRVEQKTRGQAKRGARTLPGATGGIRY